MTDSVELVTHTISRAISGRHVQQIRLLNMVPPGAIYARPLPDDHPRAPGHEILMHPDDWQRLVAERVEQLRRVEFAVGATEEEIGAMRTEALSHPDRMRVFGIPIVDNSDVECE